MNPLRFGRASQGRFTLETDCWLPRPREVVFPFFADPFNLEALTPPWLKFEIRTSPPLTMRAGLRIDYRIRLHGLPLGWQTEITAYEPPDRFVDEQRRGPYRTWIHEHAFVERDGGTFVQDRVQYAVLGGRLVDRLFVRRDLERIFRFRQEALRQRFA